jgi:hypothetical protein
MLSETAEDGVAGDSGWFGSNLRGGYETNLRPLFFSCSLMSRKIASKS